MGLWIVAALLLPAVAAILIGRSLSVAHLASRRATFQRPSEELWAAVNDPALMRSPGVGDVKFETVESVAPRGLVTRVVGENDFGGTWTCGIVPIVGGAAHSITENGQVYNVFFRFNASSSVTTRSTDGVLRRLRRRFGEA